MKMKRLCSAITVAVMALSAMAADNAKTDLTPKFHGALRTRWEMDTQEGLQRFQVRNARLSMEGKIIDCIGYFFQTDLCDQGKMKILDAYGKLDAAEGLQIKAGQFRMPFGIETFKSPNNYVFANRSFLGKQVMNYRAVGAQAGYTFKGTPLTIEAGAFNTNTIGDHNVWNKSVSFASRAVFKPGQWTLATGFASIDPQGFRANLVNGAVYWDDDSHWLVGGEYIHEHYCNDAAKGVSTWVGLVDWHTPIKAGVFNRLSLQLREDGMTDHMTMDGTAVEPARNRITGGATISCVRGALHCDLRVNYEKYLYHHDYEPAKGQGDKVVAELVIRF